MLKARKRLAAMQPGSRLWLETTDPLAVIDIPAFCSDSGHQLVETAPVPAAIASWSSAARRARRRSTPGDRQRIVSSAARSGVSIDGRLVKRGEQPADIVFRHVERDQHQPRAALAVGPGGKPRRRMQDLLHAVDHQRPRRVFRRAR